jgi:hypothetical protein
VFAAVRHPDIQALGIIPDGALEHHRLRGWYRVSPWVELPSDLHLPVYAEVDEDLDAEPTTTARMVVTVPAPVLNQAESEPGQPAEQPETEE